MSHSALLKDDRTAKTQQILTELVEAVSTLLSTQGSRLVGNWYTAVRQLFQSAVTHSVALSPAVSEGLMKLSQVTLETFTAQLRTENDSLFDTGLLDMVQRVDVLCAVSRYRAQCSLKAADKDLADSLCLRAITVWNRKQAQPQEEVQREEAACSILEWANAQSNPGGDMGDLKAYLSIWTAFAALLGELCLVFER